MSIMQTGTKTHTHTETQTHTNTNTNIHCATNTLTYADKGTPPDGWAFMILDYVYRADRWVCLWVLQAGGNDRETF